MKKGDTPKHDCSSCGHLERVIDLLNHKDMPPRHLFYAAYELRCGIEARLKQYLGAQKDIPKRLKKGWRIDTLGKGAERIFKSRDHILRFQMQNGRTHKVCVLLYTPVGRDLQKMGEKLGRYLHTVWDEDGKTPEWWDSLGTLVADSTVALFRANIGTLLGPPLVHEGPHGTEMQIVHDFPDKEIANAYLREFGEEGGMLHTKGSWHASFSEFDVYEIFTSRLTPYFRQFAKWIGKDGSQPLPPPYR